MIRFIPLLLLAAISPQDPTDRGKLIADLDARFRKIGSFEAEYELHGFKQFSRMVIQADYPGKKAWIQYWSADPKETEPVKHQLIDRFSLFTWGTQEDPVSVDFNFYVPDFEAGAQFLSRELDRLLARPERPSAYTPALSLWLDGKLQEGATGALRIALAFREDWCGSWFVEIASPEATVKRTEDKEIEFEIANANKTIVVDRTTGALKLVRVGNFDGTTNELRLKRFIERPAWPAIPLPKVFKAALPAKGQVLSLMDHQYLKLRDFLTEAWSRWTDLEKTGKAIEVEGILTRWSAVMTETWLVEWMARSARAYITEMLESGVTITVMTKDKDATFTAFMKWVNPDVITYHCKARTKELHSSALKYTEGWTGNPERAVSTRKLIEESMRFEKVDPEIKKLGRFPVKTVFLRELESMQK